MTYTRRRVLAAAAALTPIAGCAGGEDRTATESPTDDPPTATAAPTETPPPTAAETATETEAQATGNSAIKLWPMSVTTVFDGEVRADAIHDELDDVPAPSTVYSRDRDGGTATYFVSASPSFYVADAEDAFEDTDLSVRRVFKGVGPRYRRQYAAALRDQVADRSSVDADAVSVSVGRLGISQYLKVSAPTDQSALVPMLPEMALRRANGGTDELAVGPAGFAVAPGYFLTRNRDGLVTLTLTLNEDGIEAFTAAVESASEAALRGEFVQPVVDDETFRPFGLTEGFVTDVENGDWDGKLRMSFPTRRAGESTITRLTGLPSVPVDCEVLD